MLKLAESLTGALEVISNSIEPGNEEIQLLTKCQETAILLGENIEEKYIKNDPVIPSDRNAAEDAVHKLEGFCEAIFQLANGIANGEDENRLKKINSYAGKQLSSVSRMLTYEISDDRKEIVFLPYKAAMWDSLESLWKKADEDENTDAVVIPIPYYEKNPDGSFSKEHYEGNEYPPYVPITDYREYDFGIQCPDEIYIHNPYDENNFVTSVHPFFYSKNLKELTDKLVYVPYFVLNDPIDPDDEAVQKSIEHFVLVPGVFNAHKTIVQSQNMKKDYVNILTRYMKEEDKTHTEKEIRAFWEERIDGSGSPKFDKIKNTKAEDLDIPDEWLSIINRPDGTRKKIILYNTGITALLQNDDKMLDKIKRAFEIFYENRDDIALLWRPHPLIESTLTSMRPELWEKYKSIRDKYLEEKWGIYDDTPDMERALILSDDYYGDASSLVQLYQETGKPIMIQNAEV